jgi:hypothetical protein
MPEKESDWTVPTDAPVAVGVEIAPEEDEPFVLTMNAKDAPLKAGVRLTVEQAAMLQHQLDECLSQLDDRPSVRTRERNAERSDNRGVY